MKLVTSVELSFDGIGRPVIPVTLDGYERYLLIDTGGVHGTLDAVTATNIGLEQQRASIGIIGVTGERSNNFVTVNEFLVGGLRARNHQFMISPGGSVPDIMTVFVGTIAPNVFINYDLDLDFGSNKMNFFQQDHCEGGVIYYLLAPSSSCHYPLRVGRAALTSFCVALRQAQGKG